MHKEGMSDSEHGLQTSPGLKVCSGILAQQMHLTRALGSGLPIPIHKAVLGLTQKESQHFACGQQQSLPSWPLPQFDIFIAFVLSKMEFKNI